MNKRIISLALAVLFLGTAAMAQHTGRIEGTARLGNEDTVLHQVSITLPELKRNTVTDRNGFYEFTGLPPGRYTLTAHQEGFADETLQVTVAPQGSVTVDLRLRLRGFAEEVTVTASGTEQNVFDAIGSVSTINSTDIVRRAAVGIGDVLEGEAGVAKRSGGAGSARPVIRGFDGDRVLVAADGVRTGSLGAQSGDHSEPVDTLAAERVEVVKGPATLLYGSNAIGGVVNAVSGHDEAPHPGFRGHLSGIAGTNSSQAAASGAVEYDTRRWRFWGNAGSQRTGDYDAGGDFGTVFNSHTRNATLGTGTGFFGRHIFLTGDYGYYRSRYGIPLDAADPELRSIRMHRNSGKVSFGLRELDRAITSARFTVNVSRYQHQEIVDEQVGTTFRNAVDSYRGIFEQRPYKRLKGRFGFEGFRRVYRTEGDEVLIDGPVRQASLSAFGLEEVIFDRVTLQFGGRIENNRYRPTSASLPEREFTGFSGAMGARIDTWKDGILAVNYSHGRRAPALEELYNRGPHDGTLSYEIGDPNLSIERSNGLDLSLRHQNDRFRAEANYFNYAFSDFIFLAPTGTIDPASGFPIAAYLQDNSRFTGVELGLDVNAGRHLRLSSGFDYVNARLADGRPLPRIAPARGRLAVELLFASLTIRPEFVAVNRQDRIFSNETPTPGYGTANISATYIIAGKHVANIFAVNAYNLNDKPIYNHISFIKEISPETGRGVRFSYTLRFF